VVRKKRALRRECGDESFNGVRADSGVHVPWRKRHFAGHCGRFRKPLEEVLWRLLWEGKLCIPMDECSVA